MVSLTPQPTQAVPGEPPQPINEVPADVRPDSPDAEWLPGYWGWDAESKQFVWISGSWRLPPPGTRWVPGYWTAGAAGAQRVPGFWVAADTQQVSYLPAPPAYQDEGVDPASPPSPDVFWVPGYWAWANGKYGWEAGYWARMVQNWMWIAARLRMDAEWLRFCRRPLGLSDRPAWNAFQPRGFSNSALSAGEFQLQPWLPRRPGAARGQFVRRSGLPGLLLWRLLRTQYAQAGIYPWYAVGTGPYLYDPIFAYRGWYDARCDPTGVMLSDNVTTASSEIPLYVRRGAGETNKGWRCRRTRLALSTFRCADFTGPERQPFQQAPRSAQRRRAPRSAAKHRLASTACGRPKPKRTCDAA